MDHAMVRSSHSQRIEHCFRKWIPLDWKYSQPGSFEESVDWKNQRQSSKLAYADLEKDENNQKLIDTVYERANTDMREYWMSFMEMDTGYDGSMDKYVIYSFYTIRNTCAIMIMVNGFQIVVPWYVPFHMTGQSSCCRSFKDRLPLLEFSSAYISLVDMGLIWRLASQHLMIVMVRHEVGQTTYGGITLGKCDCWFTQGAITTTTITLTNNSYTIFTSIKDDKHERGAATQTNPPTVYSKEEEKLTLHPSHFKWIMLRLENKVWLQRLFKASAYLQKAELIYCEGNVAKNLTSGRGGNDFSFQQIEADTIILNAYPKLEGPYNGRVIIDSEDTNMYVQAA